VGGAMTHRFYLNAADAVYMLQIVTDRNRTIGECK